MLCVTCGHDNSTLGPYCDECDAWIGYVADSRGFLPQLEALREELKEGEVDSNEAGVRLERLVLALEAMVVHLDETGGGLAGLELEEVQQGVLSGFMTPVREGLTRMQELVSELEPSGEWPQEVWDQLEECQVKVIRGNEGVAYLLRQVAAFAEEAGVELPAAP